MQKLLKYTLISFCLCEETDINSLPEDASTLQSISYTYSTRESQSRVTQFVLSLYVAKHTACFDIW